MGEVCGKWERRITLSGFIKKLDRIPKTPLIYFTIS
jgi:hypothetical protein